ncbi:MAG: ribosome biogenesis GTPase Der [Chloroflexi bacterium]|nr:ribosome biogenesis GTPase Der [Chloroflexota bacterium]
MARPLVALVGRPNVGKSTLFNRLMGRPVAVVEDVAGTTRDRLYGDVAWGDREFTFVDTGGLEVSPATDLIAQVREQAHEAILDADLVLFVVDAREGITPGDVEVAEVVRRSRRPVVVVANKADNEERAMSAMEFYQLGLDLVTPVSAIHDTGIGELMAAVLERLPEAEEEPEPVAATNVAIIGRPNVGKSSLLNALVGYERAIVHSVPGTTRDALDTLLDYRGKMVRLIDTAGIRRRGHIEQGVERHSVLRSVRALSRSDVAILVIDATEGLTAQDLHIIGFARDAGKGMVVAVNKMDALTGGRDKLQETLRVGLDFVPYVPVLYVSAKSGQGVEQVLETALRVAEERSKRLPTRALSDAIERAVQRHPPPTRGGRMLRITHITQARSEAPTFVLFVNDPALVHFSYARYLENQLRAEFGFEGTPLKLVFRGREGKDKEARV